MKGYLAQTGYDITPYFTYTASMRKSQQGRYHSIFLLLIMISTNALGVEEKYNSGWRLNLDNDILAESDRDYTGGIALTLSGRRAQEYIISIETLRNGLDKLLRIDALYAQRPSFQLHSLQYGAMLFTPEDITNPEPIFDDRPYGSLFFLSNTALTVAPANDQAWLSTLTFGLLGLNAAEYLQKAIHALTDSDVANGWQNQISAGGEPTAMYTLSTQYNHFQSENWLRRHQLKAAYEANAGFSTDINASLSWRWGRINTPWWSFNPQHAEYINLGTPVVRRDHGTGPDELYVWAGTTVKYRFYSALLQGQFRDSVVTLGNDELEKLLAQVWLGVTWEFADDFRGSFFYRASTREFKGPNAHNLVWAGLTISRAY